ncbi:hypothetical protein [Burkholderia ubonensis]|nr:hypothetical protein [Burkholderia ubonensis]
MSTFTCIERMARMRKDVESAELMGQVGAVAAALGETELADSFQRAPWEGALIAKRLRDVSVDQWATGIEAAFGNAKFVALIERTVAVAHKNFWATDPAKALQFGGNRKPPEDDPCMLAITRAHRRLTSNPTGPGWITLALFCMARMIAVNAHTSFESDEWSEASFLWFALERDFLLADGASTAKMVLEADKRYLRGELPNIIGARMMHGLAEAAINGYDKPFFQ